MSAGHCREMFSRLSEYLDGELPHDLCQRIEDHMDDCPPCQALLKSLERTVRLVARSEAPPMPEDLRRALRQAWKRCRDEQD